jgi:hypothetical protein
MFDKQIKIVQANPIGAIVGMGAGYYAIKKYMPASSTPIVIVGAVVGALVGASVSQMLMGKKMPPTKQEILAGLPTAQPIKN